MLSTAGYSSKTGNVRRQHYLIAPASTKAPNTWVLLQVNWMFQQPATLELTHNWGTESDADANMHNGNDKPQGYGHIGSACIRFLTRLGAPCTVQVLSIS